MLSDYQELIYMIDNSIIKKEVKESLNKIYNNKELIDKIKLYHESYDNDLRKEIYTNEEYKNYKMLENRLNFLILSCNKYLGELKDEDN